MKSMATSGLPRWFAGGGLALGGMWVVTAFTLSVVRTTQAPELALETWPTSLAESGTAVRLIDNSVAIRDARRREQAATLARQALARSPVNVEAARTLALVETARNRIDRARILFGYAERLSRRDVPTQMWLIEDRVQGGDVANALLHYHRAMQTSSASREFLSPILAQSADDPAITRPLTRLLATRPEWWSNFLGNFVERTHSITALTSVTKSLRLNPSIPLERDRLSAILQRYVTLGDGAAARRLFDQVTGNHSDPVVDGGFERDHALVPFGWQLAETPATAGVREARDGADGLFALTLDGNDGQEAARQFLVLTPGRHAIRLLVGRVRAGLTAPPTIAIRCFPADTPIVEADLPNARNAATLRVMFTVPAGCGTQMLIVRTARVGGGDMGDKPWIDDVAVAPASGTADGK